MSQVVVTVDALKNRRVASAEKENQIDREGEFEKWRLASISGFDPVAATVGALMLPIAASWYLIGFVVKAAIYVAIAFSRLVGFFIPKKS
jgi:hypothetical protein